MVWRGSCASIKIALIGTDTPNNLKNRIDFIRNMIINVKYVFSDAK